MIGQTLRLKVAALIDIAPSLRHVRLVAADGGKLPPAAAGAHIQLVLAGPGRSFRNAYSLVSRPGARDAWDIIVRRVPASRGGSAYIHEALQAGKLTRASGAEAARVQVLLRRAHGAKDAGEPTVLGIADLELDLIRRKATRGGQRLELTAKEFLLLALFMRRKGEVLSRTEIAEQVWDMNFDSDTNVIEVAVKRLRAKMDDGFEPKLIRTVRGMGYVLETPE